MNLIAADPHPDPDLGKTGATGDCDRRTGEPVTWVTLDEEEREKVAPASYADLMAWIEQHGGLDCLDIFALPPACWRRLAMVVNGAAVREEG